MKGAIKIKFIINIFPGDYYYIPEVASPSLTSVYVSSDSDPWPSLLWGWPLYHRATLQCGAWNQKLDEITNKLYRKGAGVFMFCFLQFIPEAQNKHP